MFQGSCHRLRRFIPLNFAVFSLLALYITACGTANAAPVEGHRIMVAGPSPESIPVAKAIHAKGGNVVDVLVACTLEMGVTHPYFASLGGGGFAMVKLGGEKIALDFREMAPRSANPDTYKYKEASASLTGGLAVGVPGVAAGLYELHKKYGKLKWSQVVEPAIRLAADGFEVSGEWTEITRRNYARFTPEGRAIFFRPAVTNSQAKDLSETLSLKPGDRLKQPALAKFLKRLQKEGRSAFYQGANAKEIVALVNKTGGQWTTEDLANYQVRWLKPITTTFLGYDVSLMPPPSSGGVVIAEMLKLVEKTNVIGKTQSLSVDELHTLIEIEKLAYRGRTQLGDPDFVKNPIDDMLKDDHLAKLAGMIKPDRAIASETLLTAEEKDQLARAAKEKPETTHLSVMDGDGNTVAMTITLNGDYGSGLVTASGICLNNEMDDFTTHVGKPNMFGLIQGEANSVRAGARPLSSMSPTIIEKNGKTVLSLGSPGGPRIISAVFQVLYRTLARGLDIDTAIQSPRVHHQFLPDKVRVDRNKLPPETLDALTKKGHTLDLSWVAKVYGVSRTDDGILKGAFDARGEGAAGGN